MLFLLAVYGSSVAHAARPTPRAVVALGVLALLGPSCDQPATVDCLSPEIARRTLRLYFESARCSGVLMNARVIRTAGHCFTLGGRLLRVTSADGRELPADFTWWSRDIRHADDGGENFDQAEIHADRDLARVMPLDIAPGLGRGPTGHVVTAGFPGSGRVLHRHDAVVAETWAGMARLGRLEIYLLRSDDEWVVAPGQSGGPVFTAKACQLQLLGTLTAYDDERTYVQAWTHFPRFGKNLRFGPRDEPDPPVTAELKVPTDDGATVPTAVRPGAK